MDKDAILSLSRKENGNKTGEWETSIINKANSVGRIAGLIACIFLVLADDLLLHTRIVGMAAWIAYFTIVGATDLVLYLHFHTKKRLAIAILMFICAILDTVALFIFCMR